MQSVPTLRPPLFRAVNFNMARHRHTEAGAARLLSCMNLLHEIKYHDSADSDASGGMDCWSIKDVKIRQTNDGLVM